MLGTYLPAVRKTKYLYKLDWETRQLEAAGSKKKNPALAAQRRGTCFSFRMERGGCVCVHVKDKDGEEVNFFPVVIFFWASTEMKQQAQPC